VVRRVGHGDFKIVPHLHEPIDAVARLFELFDGNFRATRQHPLKPLKLGLAIGLALLEGQRVARRRFVGKPLAVGRLERGHLDHGGGQLRAGVGDRDIEAGRIQAKQHIALLDMLVVAHVNFGDAAGDLGADVRPRRLHIRMRGFQACFRCNHVGSTSQQF